MKHRIKVTSGDYAVHLVSPAYPELFMPTCSCGWEGAWVETRKVAEQDGGKHRKLDDSCGATGHNQGRHARDQSRLHENSGGLHENSSKVE